MDQFLAGLGTLLGTLSLGSIADWFAAVGTVGAFAVTIWIILHDRGERRRAQADAFVTYTQVSGTHAVPGKAPWTIRLYSHNTSSQPIPYTELRSVPGAEEFQMQTLKIGKKGHLAIAPGESIKTEIGFEHDPRNVQLVLYFKDSAGRTWAREVRSNEYLSMSTRKRYKRAWARDMRTLSATIEKTSK